MSQYDEPTDAAQMNPGMEEAVSPWARHKEWDLLRATQPVYLDDDLDRVILTRAQDIAFALNDRTLSNNFFNARPSALAGMGLQNSDQQFMPMSGQDDPDHARLRRLVAKAFNSQTVQAMGPQIINIVDELLDNLDIGRPFDLVASFAGPLPTLVIAAMLGIPGRALEQFKRWSNDLMLLSSAHRTESEDERCGAAIMGLDKCITRHIASRRVTPQNDLIGSLVVAAEDSDALTDEEMRNNIRLLLVAGNVTTTDLIGNAVVTLLHHPGHLPS